MVKVCGKRKRLPTLEHIFKCKYSDSVNKHMAVTKAHFVVLGEKHSRATWIFAPTPERICLDWVCELNIKDRVCH